MKIILFILLFTFHLLASERIIALAPSINEIVYALGKGEEIVGNTTYCRYPKEALSVAKVGGYFNPSIEKIVALNPSIVILQHSNHKLSQKLKKLGIKTSIVKVTSLSDIKNAILKIGHVLDKEKEAKNILLAINTELNNTKNITKNKKILIVIGHNVSLASRVFVVGQNLYFDDIINFSGNTNALQSSRKGQPILNMENIIATNPDIVILLAHAMQENGLKAPDLINPWFDLPINASNTKSIYIIDKLYAGIPSDRLVLFLKDFQDILKDYNASSK